MATVTGGGRLDAVSILKPLYGDEPRLLDNLATFLDQDHAAPIQLVCGVGRADDAAVRAVEALRAGYPDADIALVIAPTEGHANAKIGNLVNIAAAAHHPILIQSDSDIAVGRDYLARILAALDAPGVGAVTCLYRGRGDAGGWSRLAAMAVSQHFLASVLIGTGLRLARPCMGSTIALRRDTLDRIGGFEAFGGLLADDYAIGAAVRELGLRVALPPLLVTHGCRETSFAALARQELRWNRTVLAIDPAGFAGSIILHPLPLALAGALLSGPAGLAVALAALAARLAVAVAMDRVAGERTAPLLWVPARDMLSFGLYVGTFMSRSVDWRGDAFTIAGKGRLAPKDPR